MNKQSSSGLTGGLFITTLAGLGVIVGPFFVPQIEGVGKAVLALIGGFLLLMGVIGLIITKLYVKARPDLVFVRTGSGGMRVVTEGGCLVVPLLHTVKFIPTTTMRIDVERRRGTVGGG